MRVIQIHGELSQAMVSELRQAWAKRERVELNIDSVGGHELVLHQFMSTMDTFRDAELSIIGIVNGCAYSGAFMLLQKCAVRRARQHARLMFHPRQIYVCGSRPFARDSAEILDAWEYRAFLSQLSARSRVKEDTLRDWGSAERVYSAKEAREFHFIDEIVDSP